MRDNDSITSNTKEFPEAWYLPKYADDIFSRYGKYIDILLSEGIRPVPERLTAFLAASPQGRYTKEKMDQAFVAAEGFSGVNPGKGEHPDYDQGVPRLTATAVAEALQENPANRQWLTLSLERTAQRCGLSLSGDLIQSSRQLLDFLYHDISLWEADSFPLDAMMDLTNQYHWTFRSDAWSLREQLRREALIIHAAWKELLRLSRQHPLFLILNQAAPTDYFCSALPQGAALFTKGADQNDQQIFVYADIKISSSEHRDPLRNTSEGDALEQAVELACSTQRIPAVCDLSRRRSPRSFLRIARFAQCRGWGIRPLGKMADPAATQLPQAKSCSGFPLLSGRPELLLFAPWPISDPQIVPELPPDISDRFVTAPQTKPWQDDRIGARNELEMDEHGQYRPGAQSWVLPVSGVPGGWMRVHDLFKSRMARFLRRMEASACIPPDSAQLCAQL